MVSNSIWPGWETVRKIKSGSYGTVYEIERKLPSGNKEKAALKVISIPQKEYELDELRSQQYTEEAITAYFEDRKNRVLDEYERMLALKGNTNIVTVDDYIFIQKDDGFGWDIYLKMELLTPLLDSFGDTITEAEVVKIGKDICTALALCEKQNIIHRDIKPSNILVSKDGAYKLGDFGIARVMESATSSLTKGIGTYDYMAPEVRHGGKYDERADIYSLGLVLYWLLNERKLPFYPAHPTLTEKESALSRRFGGETIPAPAHGSNQLKQIVLKACAFDPKDRYQSAEDMQQDLVAYNHGSESFDRPKKPKTLPGYVVDDNLSKHNNSNGSGQFPDGSLWNSDSVAQEKPDDTGLTVEAFFANPLNEDGNTDDKTVGWQHENEQEVTEQKQNNTNADELTSEGTVGAFSPPQENKRVYYTVSFNVSGHGITPEEQSIERGCTAARPTMPSKEGYIFGGWFQDLSNDDTYDFNTPVVGDITLYAKWTKAKLTPLQRISIFLADYSGLTKIIVGAALALALVIGGIKFFQDHTQESSDPAENDPVSVETALDNGDQYYLAEDYENAWIWYQKAAELEAPNAMNILGAMYETGKGVELNYTEAKSWYEKGAEWGNTDAMYNLARLYAKGLGTTQDYDTALTWYEKAAEHGDADACFAIGNMYEIGEGIEQDYSRAVSWYELAAERGSTDAMRALGNMYLYGEGATQDYSSARTVYERAADLGDAASMYMLGLIYKNGWGVEQDYDEARAWYENAAELGNTDAMNNLGYSFSNGIGVERDYAKALNWFEKAAELGNRTAMYNLGYLYENGEGVEQDYATAITWYEKAAKLGEVDAMLNLGIIYAQGHSEEQEYFAAAWTWFKKAAEHGNRIAMYNLGVLSELGQGTDQNYTAAINWYEKAAENGNADAMYRLGVLYETGCGVSKDDSTAMTWYQKAAEHGHSGAIEKMSAMQKLIKKPNSSDFEGTTRNIYHPKKYLDEYEIMYVNAENREGVYEYYDTVRDPAQKLRTIPHGLQVTVIARENNCSCIIYYMNGNKYASWVGSDRLVYEPPA